MSEDRKNRLVALLGFKQVGDELQRGRVRVMKRDVRGSKAWLAMAPGVSACGKTPEAAVDLLRARASRALEDTK